jgi:DNA-directed RNA polymerase specialized sigma24 family protein
MPGTEAARFKYFIRHLPQTDRYILMMHYADGLSAHEVALVLDISPSRVEARLKALRVRASQMLAHSSVPDAADGKGSVGGAVAE